MAQRQQGSEGNYTVEIPSNVDLEGGEDIKVTSKDNTSEETTNM